MRTAAERGYVDHMYMSNHAGAANWLQWPHDLGQGLDPTRWGSSNSCHSCCRLFAARLLVRRMMHCAGKPMRQSDFDKIIAALDLAEFAMEEVRKRAEELRRKSALARTMEEIAALHLEAAELLQQIVTINTAVHTGNPAPHLRLVSDTE